MNQPLEIALGKTIQHKLDRQSAWGASISTLWLRKNLADGIGHQYYNSLHECGMM